MLASTKEISAAADSTPTDNAADRAGAGIENDTRRNMFTRL
jgi:hypothetical protein